MKNQNNKQHVIGCHQFDCPWLDKIEDTYLSWYTCTNKGICPKEAFFKKRFVIFGPPFVGKSTSLSIIATQVANRERRHIRTIDFECFSYDISAAMEVKELLPKENIVVGAGACPVNFFLDWVKILILPSIDEYIQLANSKAEKGVMLGKILDKYHTPQGRMKVYKYFDEIRTVFDFVVNNPITATKYI